MQITVIDGDKRTFYNGISYLPHEKSECVAIIDSEGSLFPIFLALRNEDCIDSLRHYLDDSQLPYRIIDYYTRKVK